MTNTVNNAIKELRKELNDKYGLSGNIPTSMVQRYLDLKSSIDIIESVNEDYLDDKDNEEYLLLDKFVKEYGDLNALVESILDDDYIIDDWNSETDCHNYASDVIKLIKELRN